MPTAYVVHLTFCDAIIGDAGSWVIGNYTLGPGIVIYQQQGSSESAGSCTLNQAISGGPSDWMVIPDDASDPSEVTVIVPDGSSVALNTVIAYLGPNETPGYATALTGNFPDDPVCACTPTVTPAASDRTESDYTLTVTLATGDCAAPLSDIRWSPEPTSGQGTLAAVYEGCAYDTTYEGIAIATDDDGCIAAAKFSFMLEPPCACTPVITAAATNRISSGYTLNLTLAVGDCTGPLTSIEWAPAPTSGQGTLAAVYTARTYNTTYEGSVSATDDDGCVASADFSFMLKPGSYPPSCQR